MTSIVLPRFCQQLFGVADPDAGQMFIWSAAGLILKHTGEMILA